MKVWEHIKNLAEIGGTKFETQKDAKSWMYETRTTPCEIEQVFDILGPKAMDEMCQEFQLDCLSCLGKYLDKEFKAVKDS
jgi:hypothetical protein